MKRNLKLTGILVLVLSLAISSAAYVFAAEPVPEADSISKADFYALLNETAQYEVMELSQEDAGQPITRAEAAAAIGKYWMLKHDFSEVAAESFEDITADTAGASEIGALVEFGVIPAGGEFLPDTLLTPEDAADYIFLASLADLYVRVGEDTFIRDTMELHLDSETVLTDDDILVDRSIIEKMGGSEVSETYQQIEAEEGQVIFHLSQHQAALTLHENRVSLNDLADAFGGIITLTTLDDEVIGANMRIDRFLMKSNRNLRPEELELGYARYYLRYLETPLPERPDEIAWAAKKDLYALSSPQPDDTILNPSTYYKLLDPDFVPAEGWSKSSDGLFTTMCAVVDIPFTDETMFTDADALSWYFAWHTLRDLRYMMWNPSCHYGVFVTTGDYDTRTPEEIAAQPMRLFDNNITNWYQRAYGSINKAIEDVSLTNYDGTDAYMFNDGTNSKEVGDGIPINFVDMTDPTLANRDGTPTPYFSSSEEYNGTGHSIAEEFLIQAGVTGEPSVMSGVGVPMASMLHVLRKVNGEWKLITHFNVMVFPADSEYVNEHQLREMSILAEFLPELYLNEGGKDLEEFANPDCWIDPVESAASSASSNEEAAEPAEEAPAELEPAA